MSLAQERAADLVRRCRLIATTMYSLADHPGMRWASGQAVSGRTAEVAAELKSRSDRAWARFNELRHWCDKLAGSGDKAEADVHTLLATRIKLDRAGLPVRHGTRKVTGAISLPDLATELAAGAKVLLSDIDRLDAACGRIADRVGRVTELLAHVESDAADHGMSENHELVTLREQVHDRVNELLNDPLGESTRDLDAVHDRLTGFAEAVERLARVRTDYPDRLAGLHGLVTELAEAESHTADVCALASAKVANPAPRRPRARAASFSEQLRTAEQLAAGGSWHVLLQQLDQWHTEIVGALRDSRDLANTAQALLERRSELRGRFAAYTRKAARLRVVETPAVERALGRAKHLLELAPCDLPAATRALSAFQESIAAASTKETSG